MREIGKIFGIVVVVIVPVLIPPVWAAGNDKEAWRHQKNGEVCMAADVARDRYAYNGVSWGNLPPGLRRTIALCDKYKDYKVKSSPAYCNQPNMLFLTSRRDAGCD